MDPAQVFALELLAIVIVGFAAFSWIADRRKP
jgi:hypothetical protein